MSISKDQWEWFGSPAHFIGAFDCRFHLTTLIGKHVVSTVGEYFPKGRDSKIETIGLNRTYETMVFAMDDRCPCGCGLPTIMPSELEMAGYNDAADATTGHHRICEQVSGWDELSEGET